MKTGPSRFLGLLLLFSGQIWAGTGRSSSPPEVASAPSCGYRIVRSYPHDPQAFTQGLQFEEGFLYESTGQYGFSSIRRVELETGKVLQIQNLPSQYFGEGLLIWGNQLVQLTWTSGIGFIYDKASFKMGSQFRYTMEGWGITSDGQQWILSDGTSLLYFMDPKDQKITKWLEVKDGTTPIRNLNELEYIQGEVFANIWQEDRIARIQPENGQVVGWLHMDGLLTPAERARADVLNGIAYDKSQNRIFVTGKYWPRLFELQLVLPGKTSRIRK
jgi:glutaminyl-peptide cyclotransferase